MSEHEKVNRLFFAGMNTYEAGEKPENSAFINGRWLSEPEYQQWQQDKDKFVHQKLLIEHLNIKIKNLEDDRESLKDNILSLASKIKEIEEKAAKWDAACKDAMDLAEIKRTNYE